MRKSGEYLARRIGVEAACITAGAAAGLVLGIGACTQSSPNQRNASVLTLRGQDTPYLRAAAGALRIVTIDPSPDIGTELRKAVTDGTVAVFIDAAVAESQGMRVAELLQAMKMSYVPVIVDAAAELPPRANLTRFLEEGAALVAFSGGKEIGGPQSSGLLLGDTHLIDICFENSVPHHGVGRAMKVDKETIAGLVCAVDLFLDRDDRAVHRDRESLAREIADSFTNDERVIVRLGDDAGALRPAGIPRIFLRPLYGKASLLQAALRAGYPAVAVGVSADNEIIVSTQLMSSTDGDCVVRAIKRELPSG